VTPVSTHIDKAAIGLSFACTVHCLLLPIALLMVPTLAASTFGDERFHQWMLIAVLPTSLIALAMGCRQHHNKSVLIIGLLGLTTLSLAIFLGHDLLGDMGEKIASVLGASLIALGHFKNHTLCKHAQCRCGAN
jgi:putative Mn2+ efflux pump MntP